ncbi:MAG: methyltransferase domain-containing protein [Betaproteobacteria bacterium]|nr:methyltransferase domain-containing protein [Betaproteobacteria bacterium]
MHFSSLSEADLQLSRNDIMRVMAPFVKRRIEGDDAEWDAIVRKRKKNILRRNFRRMTLGWLPRHQRRPASIIDEYTQVWRVGYGSYDPANPPARYRPWHWGEERLLANDFGAARFRQLVLVRLIERLQPRSVLEVGCGLGIHLILLACRFPQIAFTGVELTGEGHGAARKLQQLERLPEHLVAFAPEPLQDLTAFRRIDFRQGDATALTFPEASFDLVYTVLALEQMERVRERALAEVARVTHRHYFGIEPFRDVNDSGWERLYVLGRDYLRGRIADLPRHGLVPTLAFSDFPQERFLKACAVLTEKRSSEPGAFFCQDAGAEGSRASDGVNAGRSVRQST